MKYSIKGKNIEITEAINDFIENRLDILSKYFIFDDESEIKVLVKVHNDVQKIEVTIPTRQGVLRAEAGDKDLYVAIDSVVDKLESQIRKQKTKLKNHRENKLGLGHAFDIEFIASLDEIEDIEQEEYLGVVRTKLITPEAKDIETAIMEMEMLHHSFYIFRDIETEKIAVIYKRKDGGYGLIETN